MATETRAIPLELLGESLRHDIRFNRVSPRAFKRLLDMVSCLEMFIGDEALQKTFTPSWYYQSIADFLEGLIELDLVDQIADLGPNRAIFRALIEEYRSGLAVQSSNLRSLVQFYAQLQLTVTDVMLSQVGLWIPEDIILIY